MVEFAINAFTEASGPPAWKTLPSSVVVITGDGGRTATDLGAQP